MATAIEEVIRRLPMVAAVMGEEWLLQNREWAEGFIIGPRLAWYGQLEGDLAALGAQVALEKLISGYRAPLRDKAQIQKTIFEVHGAALLAAAAARVELHVPRGDGSGKNFDLRAEIRGHPVNAECKTRKDEFPFNLPPEPAGPAGITSHAGVRETMDPHDAAELGIKPKPGTPGLHHIETPESTVIRQLLLDGLSQLPDSGYNLILFGDIEGHRDNLEDALLGTEVTRFRRNPETRQVIAVSARAPTGAFSAGPAGEPFRLLGGVLWIRLWRDGDVLGRAYMPCPNPNARPPLPRDVIEAIVAVMNEWARPQEAREPETEG